MYISYPTYPEQSRVEGFDIYRCITNIYLKMIYLNCIFKLKPLLKANLNPKSNHNPKSKLKNINITTHPKTIPLNPPQT